ncbi:hypothetical protein Rsub_09798 [Raphidocelis subcapitata]|uniref:Uncharacterized protein n=1 Tax=Raphidocelis subcapitata TaxID=307507 RepID=A0A2V0PAW6_9CHLO|nr:hypothetical protein Rsub_09798 [Raphidocelis subcapitata]|eukprot:GBF97001.1 hypothetical protein Rsub_09798 [Raphidocelis subcapitata]
MRTDLRRPGGSSASPGNKASPRARTAPDLGSSIRLKRARAPRPRLGRRTPPGALPLASSAPFWQAPTTQHPATVKRNGKPFAQL